MTEQWGNSWSTPQLLAAQQIVNLNPMTKYDAMSQDEILMTWDTMKKALKEAKETEMDMRKYVVQRAFPAPKEGTNTLDLGNGYALKAGVSFNYNLINDNDAIENVLDVIALTGNEGAFIASAIITWKAEFHEGEYKKLKEAADTGSVFAAKMIEEIHKVLIIKDAAPTLEIKEPKKAKK